jgi:hypothetical protein
MQTDQKSHLLEDHPQLQLPFHSKLAFLKHNRPLYERMENQQFNASLQGLYREHHIPPGSQSIRILRIVERVRETSNKRTLAGVKCMFDVTTLEEAPQFVALSYTWGPEVDVEDFMTVHGLRVPIRQNLHDALRHILHPNNDVEEARDTLSPVSHPD